MKEGRSVKAFSQPLIYRIHHYLREAIIKNEIKPRNIIREKDIAVVFNSSTTPVREAIKRLASEGFFKVHPYRHILYTQWTRNDSLLKKSLRIHKKMTEALIARDTSHISSIVKKHWEL